MSNRRKDRPVPKGFRKFDGEYEKRYYKVITYNHVLWETMWPNAGYFHSGDGKRIPFSQVFAVCESYEK